jgi:flagellar hook-associated protein 3 FlgL
MRVADSMRFDTLKDNIASVKEKLDKNQTMISSQKKILVPSDDPIVAGTSLELQAEKSANGQYTKNLEKLKMLGGFYDSSMSTIHDLLTRAKEIAVSQSSDTMDASTRASAAEEVGGIIEELVTVGNTKTGSTYIFGGKKADAAPFSIDGGYNVTFNGTTDVPSVAVDKGAQQPLGIAGSKIFISADVNIFDALRDFKTALENNDTTNIRNGLDTIDKSLTLTEDNTAYVGTYTNQIDTLTTLNGVRDTNLSQTISSMTDADMVQTISDFNALSTTYQTLLYTLSKVQDLTVLNYLK